MTIQIRGHLKATEAIRQHIDRRLMSAVGRFQHRVRAVTIWLEDTNGPRKGGADKACQIEVLLDTPHHKSLIVEEVDADMYNAISRASERVSQAVRRDVGRVNQARVRSSATAS
jgi:ribosomal subunit interface protein